MAKLKVNDIDTDRYQEGVRVSKQIMEFWRLFAGKSVEESLWYVYQDPPTEDLKFRFLIRLMADSRHFQYAWLRLKRIVAGMLEAGDHLPEPVKDWAIEEASMRLPMPAQHPDEPRNIQRDIGVGNAVFNLLDEGWPLARNAPTVKCHCTADAVADAARMSYQNVMNVWYNKVGHENNMRRISEETGAFYSISRFPTEFIDPDVPVYH